MNVTEMDDGNGHLGAKIGQDKKAFSSSITVEPNLEVSRNMQGQQSARGDEEMKFAQATKRESSQHMQLSLNEIVRET